MKTESTLSDKIKKKIVKQLTKEQPLGIVTFHEERIIDKTLVFVEEWNKEFIKRLKDSFDKDGEFVKQAGFEPTLHIRRIKESIDKLAKSFDNYNPSLNNKDMLSSEGVNNQNDN